MKMGPFSKREHVAITTLGLEFASAEVLGGALGLWLDSKWETSPWMFLLGVAVGFALGMYMIIRGARQMEQQEKSASKATTDYGHN